MIVAALVATLIGFTLGLLGGGGSVLAVPMLIYIADLSDKGAIATSLVLVSGTSLVALVNHALAKNVDWRAAVTFAPPAMLGAYLGGRLAVALPGGLLIGGFSLVMLVTAISMWPPRVTPEGPAASTRARSPVLAGLGLGVGLVTGLVGAGGGFLVVPALALLVGLPMHRAIGTSLVIIAVNSAAALLGFVTHVEIDLQLAAAITLTASIGALVGSKLVERIDTQLLRRGFALLVFIMGITLLLRAWHRGVV